MLCVGQFGACLEELVCAVCGTVWCGFVGVSVQQVVLCCVCISALGVCE